MMSMVAGSLPGIVTRNENRRINKEGINDEFLVNIYNSPFFYIIP